MPHDHVGAQAEIRNGRSQLLCQPPVHSNIVRAPHEAQHTVAAALERQVLVRHDHGQRGDGLDQGRREIGGQNGREPEPSKALDLGHRSHQRGEARSRQQVPAVVADVHAGQGDLAVAGLDQRLGLLDDHLRILAPTPPPRRGDDAERAPVLAAVLDLEEGPRASGDPSHGSARHLAGLGDGAHPHLRGVSLDKRADQLGEPVLLAIAEDEIHAGHARESIRIGLGEAAGDDDERIRIRPRDATYGLAVGEVGATRHRAGIDHVDLGGLAIFHGAKAGLLDQGAKLPRLDLVEPAAERGEADGRPAHTETVSLSWPQAAPMSSPLLQRTVARTPCSSRMAWKPRMRWSGGR